MVKLPSFKNPYDPSLLGRPFDWAGRWRNRHEQVIEQVTDAKDGQRQWAVRCLCGRDFVIAEKHLRDNRVVICPRAGR